MVAHVTPMMGTRLRLLAWMACSTLAATASFTEEMQAALLSHQMNCSAPVMNLRDTHDGLGSTIHVLTGALALAFNSGHVLTYGTWGENWTRGGECAEPGLGCFFQPLSPCPPKPASAFVDRANRGLQSAIPHGWQSRLPTMSDAELRQWWRAQGALFIVRLTPSAKREVARMRGHLRLPAVLPKGTVSMHVRRADKGTEADLVPLGAYFDEAERTLVARGERARVVFLTTDGAEVDHELASIPAGWAVIRPAGATYTPGGGLEVFSYSLAMQSMALLAVHLEADHFVGTRFSNWCRLIDELRLVGPHPACCLPYVDVPSPLPSIAPYNIIERLRRRSRMRTMDYFKYWRRM